MTLLLTVPSGFRLTLGIHQDGTVVVTIEPIGPIRLRLQRVASSGCPLKTYLV